MNVETIKVQAKPWSGASGSDEGPSLLDRIRSGDEAAYEILVRDNTGRMLSVARRYLRSDEDARDAVQDAFISAYRSIERFQGEANISTWLHRILINVCLMKIRSSKRRPQESIEELLPTFDESGHRVSALESGSESAETLLERSTTRARVRACIDCLPDKYRTVLILRDIEELSTEEAAKALGTTVTAVKVRLHRARQALKTLLQPIFHGE